MSMHPDRAAALLASPVRRSLTAALTPVDGGPTEPALTAADLAELVGLHVTTVRFHLDRLVDAGVVTARFHRPGGAGRPRKIYAITPGALADDHAEVESLRLLSALLVESLAAGADGRRTTPDEAGRRWALEHLPLRTGGGPANSAGRWLGKLAQMVHVLEQWGYTPEVATSDGGRAADVTLSHCPFLELARGNPAVVCGIHRGLISGSLERLGEDDVSVSLEPFVTPTTCRAHIRTATIFRTPASKDAT